MNFHIHPENLPTDEHGHPKTSLSTDWFEGRFQWLIFDQDSDPAVAVRISDQGDIEEIAVRKSLLGRVMSDEAPSPWIVERDNERGNDAFGLAVPLIQEPLPAMDSLVQLSGLVDLVKEIAKMAHERERDIASEDAIADRNELINRARKLLGMPMAETADEAEERQEREERRSQDHSGQMDETS